MRASASSEMPAPRSRTATSTIAPARRAHSRTSLPGGEYFTALETRLARMRSRASGSASTRGSPGAQSTTIVSAAPRRKRSAVAASAASTATGTRWSVGSRPRSMRERSSRSLTIRPRRAASARMIPAIRRTSSGAVERADPLDREHADRLTGHEERRGEHPARPAAIAHVGDEHRRPAGEHAGGDRPSSNTIGARHHLTRAIAHDQPDVGRAQPVDEHGAQAPERGLERSRARQCPLDRQNGLVPRPLPARARGERAAEGPNARDDGAGHEPLDRLRREPRALDLEKHDRRIEAERGPGAQRAAEPAERERQCDDGEQKAVTEHRRGTATGQRDQRCDNRERQRRRGGEPARHPPVPSSRYAAKKTSALTTPGTRLPDHQKSQQFPALRSVR